jgi:hypothetical protein
MAIFLWHCLAVLFFMLYLLWSFWYD